MEIPTCPFSTKLQAYNQLRTKSLLLSYHQLPNVYKVVLFIFVRQQQQLMNASRKVTFFWWNRDEVDSTKGEQMIRPGYFCDRKCWRSVIKRILVLNVPLTTLGHSQILKWHQKRFLPIGRVKRLAKTVNDCEQWSESWHLTGKKMQNRHVWIPTAVVSSPNRRERSLRGETAAEEASYRLIGVHVN